VGSSRAAVEVLGRSSVRSTAVNMRFLSKGLSVLFLAAPEGIWIL